VPLVPFLFRQMPRYGGKQRKRMSSAAGISGLASAVQPDKEGYAGLSTWIAARE
jgi:hypothetical protein